MLGRKIVCNDLMFLLLAPSMGKLRQRFVDAWQNKSDFFVVDGHIVLFDTESVAKAA